MTQDRLCYFCNSELDLLEDDLHDGRLGNPGAYSVYACPSCGLGKTIPEPSELSSLYERVLPDRPQKFYRSWYQSWSRSRIGVHSRLRLDGAGRLLGLLASTGLERGSRLLDVGCGVGDWMILFRDMGFDVFGIDMNSKAIEIATERDLNVRLMRAEDLADSGEKFDAIVLSQLLEHLPDPLNALRTMKKILEPAGSLLLAVPNLDSRLRRRFGKNWANWYVPLHLFHFTPEALWTMLDEAGFGVVRTVEYTPPSWWLNSLMVNLFSIPGIRNDKVAAWWHQPLYPLLLPFLAAADKLNPGLGDCQCVLAKKRA